VPPDLPPNFKLGQGRRTAGIVTQSEWNELSSERSLFRPWPEASRGPRARYEVILRTGCRALTSATKIRIASSLEKPAAWRAFFFAARYSASVSSPNSEWLANASVPSRPSPIRPIRLATASTSRRTLISSELSATS